MSKDLSQFTMMGNGLRIGGREFQPLDVDGRASVTADLPDDRRGVYIYKFSDGTWYAGKSVDVASRYVQHRHEYRHDGSSHVVETMWFSPVLGNDAEELDAAETQVISALERAGYELTNVLKTDTPGGSGDVVVHPAPGVGVSLPWDRGARPRTGECGTIPIPSASASNMRSFERLTNRDYWSDLLALLAAYVDETIPAPDSTVHVRWVATAMPSTGGTRGYRRIMAISCQNLETLVVFDEGKGPWGFVNMREMDSLGRKVCRRFRSFSHGFHIWPADYQAARGVSRVQFDGLRELSALLSRKDFLDSCYRLNIELMRKGPTMFSRFDNPPLVRAILSAVEKRHASEP